MRGVNRPLGGSMEEYERLKAQAEEIMRKQASKAAKKIVKAILEDLNGRKGLGIDDLDDEIQKEIKQEWEELTAEVIFQEGLTR